jgi:hypothetical protein
MRAGGLPGGPRTQRRIPFALADPSQPSETCAARPGAPGARHHGSRGPARQPAGHALRQEPQGTGGRRRVRGWALGGARGARRSFNRPNPPARSAGRTAGRATSPSATRTTRTCSPRTWAPPASARCARSHCCGPWGPRRAPGGLSIGRGRRREPTYAPRRAAVHPAGGGSAQGGARCGRRGRRAAVQEAHKAGAREPAQPVAVRWVWGAPCAGGPLGLGRARGLLRGGRLAEPGSAAVRRGAGARAPACGPTPCAPRARPQTSWRSMATPSRAPPRCVAGRSAAMRRGLGRRGRVQQQRQRRRAARREAFKCGPRRPQPRRPQPRPRRPRTRLSRRNPTRRPRRSGWSATAPTATRRPQSC